MSDLIPRHMRITPHTLKEKEPTAPFLGKRFKEEKPEVKIEVKPEPKQEKDYPAGNRTEITFYKDGVEVYHFEAVSQACTYFDRHTTFFHALYGRRGSVIFEGMTFKFFRQGVEIPPSYYKRHQYPETKPIGIKIKINGVKYDSITDAGKALGFTSSSMHRMVRGEVIRPAYKIEIMTEENGSKYKRGVEK